MPEPHPIVGDLSVAVVHLARGGTAGVAGLAGFRSHLVDQFAGLSGPTAIRESVRFCAFVASSGQEPLAKRLLQIIEECLPRRPSDSSGQEVRLRSFLGLPRPTAPNQEAEGSVRGALGTMLWDVEQR